MKRGIQCFPLTKNIDYTICIEILNVDYQLWHINREFQLIWLHPKD